MSEQFSFGAWVRRRRKALDLTREELAPQIGCSVVTIRRIEADERRPSKQLAARLADCLEIAAEERAAFLKAARGELAVDQLATPTRSLEHSLAADAPAVGQDTSPSRLPSGTVTFLFSDIEGSTRLWELHSAAMPQALARHDALLRAAITSNAGVLVKSTGDGVLAAFERAPDALSAALEAQRALQAADWSTLGELHVRMALHAGTAEARAGDYFGPPLNRAARLLAAGHGGQVLLSLAAAELVRDLLPPDITLHDLGEHQLKDLSRPEHIFQLVVPDFPSVFPPLRSLSRARTNLPAQLTQLIGREREVAQVCALLRRRDVRLATLTGAGGAGKTRLALQVAAELLDHFVHGVYFVDLAPIRDPALVVGMIAEALGLKESARQPLIESLKRHLRERELLLLLDNFEQIVDAAPLVAELLKAAPALKVQVTSRTILHLSGEHEFIVLPLTLPPQEPRTKNQEPAVVVPDSVLGSRFSVLSGVEELTRYESVALFIERARAVKADFQVANDTATAVAEICRRLDGLPLAIELAAARIKLFAPEELLARLERRLPLLTGGPRDMPQRQQTLRATIDWSYQLLDRAEQMLFTRLAVFVGGWSLEAAEAVCDPAGDLGIAIVDGLQLLLDKSLLREVAGPDEALRFTMLETIREYALEQLVAREEQEAVQRPHAAHYLALAERAEPEHQGPEQVVWLARLELEHGNLRAALQWAAESRAVEVGVRLAMALWWFWWERGWVTEARTWLTEALKRSSGLSSALRAKALKNAGWLASYQGDYAAAHTLLVETLAILEELGDIPGRAEVLRSLGFAALMQGYNARARDLLEVSLALSRELGDKLSIATTLLFLGSAVRLQKDTEQTRMVLEESMALCQALGDKGRIAWVFNNLGYLAYQEGDAVQARMLQEQSLALMSELAHPLGIAACLEGFAGVAELEGQPARAVRLFGAAASIRDVIGIPPYDGERVDYARRLGMARTQLGLDAFDAAWAEGRALDWEHAITYAVDEGT